MDEERKSSWKGWVWGIAIVLMLLSADFNSNDSYDNKDKNFDYNNDEQVDFILDRKP